jgi:hypothetical protein
MTRVITLPSGRQVTLAEYVRSWKVLKTLPADRYVAGFSWFERKASEILKEIRYGVHDRINQRAAGLR